MADQRAAAAASRNTGNKEKLISHGDTRRRMKMRWETGQMVMDSCNRIYHDVENEEIYLWVVVVVAGTRRFARKSSPEVRRKPSLFRTSASDLGGFGWRLRKRVVLLEPLRREEHRHIYSPRVWKRRQADPFGLLCVDIFLSIHVLARLVGPHNRHGDLQQ